MKIKMMVNKISADTFVCFVREVVTVVVAECAFLISAFREVEEAVVEEEDAEEFVGCICCRAGSGREVETVVVFEESLGGALLRCAATCFPVDPPPFCDGLFLTTFNSSIWVSAVPCARPKSTSAYLCIQLHKKTNHKSQNVIKCMWNLLV